MFKIITKNALSATALLFSSLTLAQTPNDIQPSNINIRLDLVTTMPLLLDEGLTIFDNSSPNIGSPVVIRNKLYLLDQNGAIYRVNGNSESDISLQLIFEEDEAPDNIEFDNRQGILNITDGPGNTLYVIFTTDNEPVVDIPIYRMPSLPGQCCLPSSPIDLSDLYRVGQIPIESPTSFFRPTRTLFQVVYEYKLAGNKLKDPRAIAAFETQSSVSHNGGGLLTLEDGRLLFVTGDGLPFGNDGRAAAQDPNSHLSKALLLDPKDGSYEVAAVGLRNVQHLEYSEDRKLIAFADIGGVTAEEVNFVSVADLLDTRTLENFGWGQSLEDGVAREGTFYIGPGLALAFGPFPPTIGIAPTPEPGYIQPHAQYGRGPFGGQFVAVSGPVQSSVSLPGLTTVFADLNVGALLATTGAPDEVATSVFHTNIFYEGVQYSTLNEINDGNRVDARFFRFPDRTAGLIFENTGEIFKLTRID